MIVEEPINDAVPISSFSKATTVEKILSSIKETCPHFKNAISNPAILKPINENKYTQVFVEQLNYQLIKANFTFLAANQYSDLFHNTKGVPDFYFYNLEEGVTATALFVVEAKILPSPPPKIREREYVFGDNVKGTGKKECNGGIERFKIEKHGYGLSECGLLAFIEKDSFADWLININEWIDDLSTKEPNWSIDEKLEILKVDTDFSYSKSRGRIDTTKKVQLHHFWINLC
jgi:hypothetical protein